MLQSKIKQFITSDVPWRPSEHSATQWTDIRQGNENKEVDIYHYITKGSFDNYLPDAQENKLPLH